MIAHHARRGLAAGTTGTDRNAPIGTIAARGVPLILTPVPLAPGFARLGIVRFQMHAGETVGKAEIEATLDGGTTTTVHAIVGN